MRILQPKPLLLQTESSESLKFKGQNGETFQVTVLEEDIIRVQHFPDGEPRLKRTWSIAGVDGDVPLEGRQRSDLSSFRMPGFTLQQQDGLLQVSTACLQVQIDTTDCSLVWKSRQNGVAFCC